MPQLQTLDLGQDESPLEKTLAGFNKRREDLKEIDALKQVYQRYQEGGQQLSQILPELQTNPDLSPTTRVNNVKTLIDIQKYNDQQAAKVQKQLKEVEDKSYKREKEDRIKAYQEDTKKHRDAVEKRLNENNITTSYNHEISQINNEMKNALSEKQRAPLREKLEDLKSKKSRDIRRFRGGERDFDLELYDDGNEIQQVQQKTPPQAMPAIEQQDPVIVSLTETFPPAQFQGKSKWDKDSNEYKSDGIRWVRV